jgi:hypothetical protein
MAAAARPTNKAATGSSIAKDRLEKRVRVEVCSGRTDLLDAQQEIAKDWIATR